MSRRTWYKMEPQCVTVTKEMESLTDTEMFHILYWFFTGHNSAQHIFCDLIDRALAYKYRSFKGLAIPVTPEFARENPVFEFKARDRIRLEGDHVVDGRLLRELFVTTIFARIFDLGIEFRGVKNRLRKAYICYPKNTDTEVDTYLILVPSPETRTAHRMYFPTGSIIYSLQIKEYVTQRAKPYQRLEMKERVSLAKVLDIRKLKAYDNFVLVYFRGFFEVDFDEIKRELGQYGLKDKDIFFIGTPWADHVPSKWSYNIWDLRHGEMCEVSFDPCDLFHSIDLCRGI